MHRKKALAALLACTVLTGSVGVQWSMAEEMKTDVVVNAAAATEEAALADTEEKSAKTVAKEKPEDSMKTAAEEKSEEVAQTDAEEKSAKTAAEEKVEGSVRTAAEENVDDFAQADEEENVTENIKETVEALSKVDAESTDETIEEITGEISDEIIEETIEVSTEELTEEMTEESTCSPEEEPERKDTDGLQDVPGITDADIDEDTDVSDTDQYEERDEADEIVEIDDVVPEEDFPQQTEADSSENVDQVICVPAENVKTPVEEAKEDKETKPVQQKEAEKAESDKNAKTQVSIRPSGQSGANEVVIKTEPMQQQPGETVEISVSKEDGEEVPIVAEQDTPGVVHVDLEQLKDNSDTEAGTGSFTFTVSTTAKDETDVKSVKKQTFTVDDTESVYLVSEETVSVLEQYYTEAAPVIEMQEFHATPIKNAKVLLSCNGELRTLAEEDYQVEERAIENGYCYSYKIPAELCEAEGVYEVILLSEDAAGNRVASTCQKQKISFAVDHTAPEYLVIGDEQTLNGQVSILVRDDLALAHADLYVDGDIVPEDKKEILPSGEMMVRLHLPAGDEAHTIRIIAEDEAGNELNVSEDWQWAGEIPVKKASAVNLMGMLYGLLMGSFMICRKFTEKRNA